MKIGTHTRAVVTGGSSGIGNAIAADLAVAGATVVLVARNSQRLEAAREALIETRGLSPERILTVAADVADPDQAMRLRELGAKIGPPNLLVNSHGITYPERFERIDSQKLEELLRVNVVGVWNTIQALLPDIRTTAGTIANVASVGGFVGVYGYSAYSASKFAVVGLSEVLRNELKPDGIRVVVLCPPDTDTPMLAAENQIKPFETKEMSKSIPVMKPEAVSAAFIKGLRRRGFMIVPGFMSNVSLRLKGIWPGLLFGIIDSDLAKARAAKESAQGGV
jgi:3-dehydrosphinganine reductase